MQAILGIPFVRRLKLARGEGVKAWPFETGFKALTEADLSGVEAVVAEVYPSLLKPQGAPGEVKKSIFTVMNWLLPVLMRSVVTTRLRKILAKCSPPWAIVALPM